MTAVPWAPAAAALLIALRVVRGDRAVARLVVGAAALALAVALLGIPAGAPHLAVVVAAAGAFIALVVSGFAARSMQGGSIPYAPFFALLAAATAGSLAIAVATDLRVLAAAWIATGLCATGLLGAARAKPAARQLALRHLAIERAGDAAWIVVLLVAWHGYHTFDLATISERAAPGAGATAIALALVVVAATRSAIVPFHRWLPDSMEAPTSVSAFLHAGVVNGAGILFAKTAFLIVAAPTALIVAGVLGAGTAAAGATIALVRPETKRRLGWSTVAQMGFMVLQCGCGAFGAAVLHLVAHGGYKSAAFLGSAGSIERYRRAPAAPQRSARPADPAHRAMVALTPATLGVVLAAVVLRDRLAALPACAMVLAIAWTTGTCAARRCLERPADARTLLVALAAVGAAVAAYLAGVCAIDAWLGVALPHVTVAAVALPVAVLVVAAGLLEGLGLRPRVPDLLYTLALTEGRAAPMERT